MRRVITCAGLMLLGLVLVSAPAAAQANVAGSWAITIEGPEGPAEAMAELEQDGATFTGTISVDQTDGAEILSGAVEGDSISFVLSVSVQGQAFDLQVAGEVDGDMIEGQMYVPDFGGFPFTAVRQ